MGLIFAVLLAKNLVTAVYAQGTLTFDFELEQEKVVSDGFEVHLIVSQKRFFFDFPLFSKIKAYNFILILFVWQFLQFS